MGQVPYTDNCDWNSRRERKYNKEMETVRKSAKYIKCQGNMASGNEIWQIARNYDTLNANFLWKDNGSARCIKLLGNIMSGREI